jgi:hypothetical protein
VVESCNCPLDSLHSCAAEAFGRAGYFTLECEAPNPRLYSFEGAICRWDISPLLGFGIGPGVRGRPMKSLAPRPDKAGALGKGRLGHSGSTDGSIREPIQTQVRRQQMSPLCT